MAAGIYERIRHVQVATKYQIFIGPSWWPKIPSKGSADPPLGAKDVIEKNQGRFWGPLGTPNNHFEAPIKLLKISKFQDF